jgi:hypothetical protein
MDSDQKHGVPPPPSQGNFDKPKQSKRRFAKLTAEELAGLPGVTTKAPKPAVQAVTYSAWFSLPVTGSIASTAEAERIHDFARKLDEQAKAKDVGGVTGLTFGNGTAEIALKLDVREQPASNAVPVASMFAQLNDFFVSAPVLRVGVAGKCATWKAKVNGTTITEGTCDAV